MQTSGTTEDSAPATRLVQWFACRPYLSLTLLVLLALGPFVTRPLNIDDPLFVWSAKQIAKHPADPFGFNVNWFGSASPMYRATKNPPLTCYYLAGAGVTLGWSEIALHTAMLLPTIAAVLGTYRLARRLCPRPGLAAVATLFSPVFLVSSATLMCDTMMLAFWLWATVLWLEGLELNNHVQLLAAGILIGLATLSKYFGASLIPLLFVYTLVRRRKLGLWAACLLIPLAMVGAYEAAAYAKYGVGLFNEAGWFAADVLHEAGPPRLASTLITLGFIGGCLAFMTFLTPFVWPWRTQLIFAACTVVMIASVFADGRLLDSYSYLNRAYVPWLGFQMAFWTVGGMGVLGLVLLEIQHDRTPDAWLLCLWVVGTSVFTMFCNWTVNGRSIQPLAPAVAMLLARRWDVLVPSGRRRTSARAALVLGAVMGWFCVRADFNLASAVRLSAQSAFDYCRQYSGHTYVAAHWGFQYYMENLGAKPYDLRHLDFEPDDSVVHPFNNDNTTFGFAQEVHLATVLVEPGPGFLTASDKSIGAGFYSSFLGPVPFAIGLVPSEHVYVYRMGPAPSTPPQPTPSP